LKIFLKKTQKLLKESNIMVDRKHQKPKSIGIAPVVVFLGN